MSSLRGAISMILAVLLTHMALGAAPSHEAASIGTIGSLHRGPRGDDISGEAFVTDVKAPHSGGGGGASSAPSMGGSSGPRDGHGTAAADAIMRTTGPVVVVSGATGRTGSLLYLALRSSGVAVRALVRNASKAREMLDCGACDEEAVSWVARGRGGKLRGDRWGPQRQQCEGGVGGVGGTKAREMSVLVIRRRYVPIFSQALTCHLCMCPGLCDVPVMTRASSPLHN